MRSSPSPRGGGGGGGVASPPAVPRAPSMSATSTDRNLLFGLLALHNHFISREALLDAMTAWLARKEETLAAILVERGVLGAHRAGQIEALTGAHVEHHGDARQSLAAVSVEPTLREGLARLADEDVQGSIASMNTAAGWVPPP